MSIKRYLFVLFGTLIIVLGVSQFLVTHYFKDQLQSELSSQSEVLSKNLVKVLIDNVASQQELVVEFNEFDEQAVEEEIQQEIAELHNDFNVEISQLSREVGEISRQISALEFQRLETKTVQEEKEVKQQLVQKERRLKQHLKQISAYEHALMQDQQLQIAEAKREAAEAYQDRLNQALSEVHLDAESWLTSGNVEVITLPDPNGPSQINISRAISVPNSGTTQQLDELTNIMLLMIAITSILALILVYWLSHFISQPLSQLANGHQKLGQGELGFQVKEQGVKELKSILQGFNSMSKQLARLSEKEQLMSQQKQLAELGEVTRGIAHSLRNPLHTVGLLSEAAAQAENAQQAQTMLAQIQQKITLMDKSIQSLLTLSSSQVRRDTPVPIVAIIQDIMLELAVNGAKVQIMFTSDEQLMLRPIMGAESELRSIVHAVLINAVEASDEGGEVSVSISQTHNQQVIEVVDTGKGIADEIKARLFQPHVTSKAEGTGMGLYIAQRLLQGHYHGSMSLSDHQDGGTIARICFNLPNDSAPIDA
ncbi:ATP-binding protein [Shewanella waksmanii]|uniref:sensor histidine kinase n=1 Tax=Shewanella waksmanii TaxID=213783 RepID=UPI003735C224